MSQLYVDNIKNRTGGAPTLSQGVVVSAAATFSGNVSIAGTITYEDVTNVDSVGVITARSGIKIGAGESIGPVSGTVYYYGDGSNLSNTGSTLSAASGTQRLVVTSQTSGTMTASATDADITFNAGNNTLYVGTASSSFVAPRAIGIGTTTTDGRDAGIGTAAGTVIFNNDADGGTGQLEVYTGKGWVGITSEAKAANFSATGGTKTTNGAYTVHTFLTSDTFVATGTSPKSVGILVVAGGGGGGGRHGGGGGAGGSVYLPVSNGVISPGTYNVVIGAGSAAITGDASPNTGRQGTPSSFGPPAPAAAPTHLLAIGGGFGGAYPNSPTVGGPGGSGGGGGAEAPGAPGPGSQPAPTIYGTSTGYGTNGGTGVAGSPDFRHGGGGGGAGGAGTSASPSVAGDGGVGVQINIDGNNYYWAGGGGGGNWNTPLRAGNGGLGGGGGGGHSGNAGTSPAPGTVGTGGGSAINSGAAGLNPTPSSGGNGGANTGGGGGGNGQSAYSIWPGPTNVGGAGGSGIVIVTYLT